MSEQSEQASPASPAVGRVQPKPTLSGLSCACSWKSARHTCGNKAQNTSLILVVLPAGFCILSRRNCVINVAFRVKGRL